MYGFSVSKNGILTDNYFKLTDHYEITEPQGIYILVKKKKNEIIIKQDFQGNFGLYLYQNQNKDYFAFSNSFLLLEEYLIGKQNFSINRDYANNFVISYLCSESIYETMIKEIIKIPSNKILVINIKNKTFKNYTIDYKESTIPFESIEGLKIIDKWINKWGYIIRSLLKKTDNISSDLSGGFDTRTILSIFLNSGIDINKILIHSAKDKKTCHEEDFEIASLIASKFGFKLNYHRLDNSGILWSLRDKLLCSFYSKLGFHKEFYFKNKFYEKPRFHFHGGGEIRGYPGLPIKKYIKSLSDKGKKLGNEFFFSSKRLYDRSVTLLKKEKDFENDYDISSYFYQKGRSAIHDGKTGLEGFLANEYLIQPLIDSDIKKIKFNKSENSAHDLIAYIYVRFAHDLIYFPFQGNRTLNIKSILKAEKLNKLNKPYKVKYDYNINFFIDSQRKLPLSESKDNKDAVLFLQELFDKPKFIEEIKKIFKIKVYIWAREYAKKHNYHPLRYLYGLFSIALTFRCLLLNKKYQYKFKKNSFLKEYKTIFNYFNKIIK